MNLNSLLTPGRFLLFSTVIAVVILRVGTLQEPLGDPGWPVPFGWAGSVTLLSIAVGSATIVPGFVAQVLIVSMFGWRLPLASALRASSYVAGLVLPCVAAVVVLGMLVGPFSPTSQWLVLPVAVLAQIALTWLLASRLRRATGSRRWLTFLLVLGAWALVGLVLPYEQKLKESNWVRISTWTVASESMLPTLRQDDTVAGDRWSVATSSLQRADIVLFRPPGQEIVFLHRLIGLPGDKIQYRNGRLWLNGSEVTWADKGAFVAGPNTRFRHPARVIEEQIGSLHFATLDIDANQDLDDTPEFLVPDGHVFTLGDNRDNAMDSRVSKSRRGYGMVPFEALIGRVYHRVGPDPGPLN